MSASFSSSLVSLRRNGIPTAAKMRKRNSIRDAFNDRKRRKRWELYLKLSAIAEGQDPDEVRRKLARGGRNISEK